MSYELLHSERKDNKRMSKLNRAAIVGFLCCFLMIITGVATNGGMKTIVNFLHIPSAIITFGGTFFAGMITSDSFHDYFDGLKAFFKAFQTEKVNLDEISSTIFELSSMSRKEGLLGLDVEIDKLDNDYLKKGIRLVVDGTNGERVDYRRCAIYTSGRESSCREGKDKNISCKLGRKKCRIIQNNVSIMRQGYLL